LSTLIRTEKLCYDLPGRRLLDAIDFELRQGERMALGGDNGSGKTTFLELLVGLHPTSSGTIWAFGKPRLTEPDFREVRRQAGLLFQDADDQLFSPTVLEDVAFGPLNLGQSAAQSERTALATLDRLGLSGLERRITHHLSGGEKRMVALATVLAMEPRVLLLDEPSNALDRKARERMIETLQALPQAMLLVSHDEALLQALATRRCRIESCRLVAD
jgi:cobalt/nickel transport system ATP-binding protein